MKKLKHNQKIDFIVEGKTHQGRVMRSDIGYFVYFRDYSNYFIFEMLDLDVFEFTRQHYGHQPGSGDWPEAKTLQSLTNVVEALLLECNKHNYEWMQSSI